MEGEPEVVHTMSYRCPECGATDFAPKLAADIAKVDGRAGDE